MSYLLDSDDTAFIDAVSLWGHREVLRLVLVLGM